MYYYNPGLRSLKGRCLKAKHHPWRPNWDHRFHLWRVLLGTIHQIAHYQAPTYLLDDSASCHLHFIDLFHRAYHASLHFRCKLEHWYRWIFEFRLMSVHYFSCRAFYRLRPICLIRYSTAILHRPRYLECLFGRATNSANFRLFIENR